MCDQIPFIYTSDSPETSALRLLSQSIYGMIALVWSSMADSLVEESTSPKDTDVRTYVRIL